MAAPTITAPVPPILYVGIPSSYNFTVVNNSMSVLHVAVSTPPDGMLWGEGLSGELTGAPRQAGTYSTEISASNADGGTIVTVTFTVHERSQGTGPPIIVAPRYTLFLQVGTPVSIELLATGAPTIIWTAAGMPEGFFIGPDGGGGFAIYGTMALDKFQLVKDIPVVLQIGAINTQGSDSATVNVYFIKKLPVMGLPVNPTGPVLQTPQPGWAIDPIFNVMSPFLTNQPVFSAADLVQPPEQTVTGYVITGLPDGWTYDPLTGDIFPVLPPSLFQAPAPMPFIPAAGGGLEVIIQIEVDGPGGPGVIMVPLIINPPIGP